MQVFFLSSNYFQINLLKNQDNLNQFIRKESSSPLSLLLLVEVVLLLSTNFPLSAFFFLILLPSGCVYGYGSLYHHFRREQFQTVPIVGRWYILERFQTVYYNYIQIHLLINQDNMISLGME